MKKAVYFTLGLILLSLLTNAGTSDGSKPLSENYLLTKSKAPSNGKKCFDESSRIINIGLGFGYSYYNYSTGAGITTRNLPTISVSYEQPWTKRFGPGLMGVGGYLGFKTSSWKSEYSDPYYGYTYIDRNTDLIIASRAMYHWDVLNTEKAELYGGVILGVRLGFSHYSEDYNGPYAGNSGYTNEDTRDFSLGLAYALVAGARYYFNPKFGVYSELSYGISYITVGVSLKL